MKLKFRDYLRMELDVLVKAVKDNSDLIEVRSEHLGETLLHWYAVEGYWDRVQALVEIGFSVNVLNNCGASPVTEVGRIGNYDGVKILLKLGADVGLWNKENGTNLVAVAADKNDMNLYEIIRPYIVNDINTYFNYVDAMMLFENGGSLLEPFVKLGLRNPSSSIE